MGKVGKLLLDFLFHVAPCIDIVAGDNEQGKIFELSSADEAIEYMANYLVH